MSRLDLLNTYEPRKSTMKSSEANGDKSAQMGDFKSYQLNHFDGNIKIHG